MIFLKIIQNHWEFKYFPVPETLVIQVLLNDYPESLVFKNKHFLEIIQKHWEYKYFSAPGTLVIQTLFWKVSQSVVIQILSHQGNNTFQKHYFFDSENDTVSKVSNSDGAGSSKKDDF